MSLESPPKSRYRVKEFCPEKISYRNCRLLLSFRCDTDRSWVWYAFKEGDPAHTVELLRRPSMAEWAHDRYNGFDVVTGSVADKIMAALVKMDAAVAMLPGQTHWCNRDRPTPYH